MIVRVNGLVLLPHLADWSTTPRTERRWQSTLATAVTGAEDRAALRQQPRFLINWQVVPFDLVERGQLDERIRVALTEGQAVTPWWGRGLRLAIDASGTTVTLDGSIPAAWVPAAGSQIWFSANWATAGGAVWEVAEVLSVAGSVLTLTGALTNTWPADSCCWELLPGKLVADNSDALTGTTGRYGFSLTGYRGPVIQYPGIAATIGTSDLAAPDAYRMPAPWPASIARVSLLTANLHTPLAQIRGYNSYGLDLTGGYSPVWEQSVDGGTSWTDVSSSMIEETTPGYWHYLLPFQNPVLIRVTTVFFGTPIATDPITIPAITVERMMRVTQERWMQTGAAVAIVWPVRTTDSAAPGAYPGDGFYAPDFAADLAGSVHTREIALLEAIRVALRAINFSSRYLTTTGTIVGGTTFGVISPETNAFSPVWTFTPGSGLTPPSYGPVISATSSLPSAVSTGNRLTLWRDLNRFLLRLHKLFLDCPIGQASGANNNGYFLGSASQSTGNMKPNVFTLGAAAKATFDLATFTPDGSLHRGIWSRVTPTSVTLSGITEIYNAPGSVSLQQIAGQFIVDMSTQTGQCNLYLSTYYYAYGLSFYPGVVDQHGLTPYWDVSPTGVTDIYYAGAGVPTNVPDAVGLTAHTKFALITSSPITTGSIYLSPDYCNALRTAVPFRFYNPNIAVRNIGFNVAAKAVLYRSPAVEDAHYAHYVHVLP